MASAGRGMNRPCALFIHCLVGGCSCEKSCVVAMSATTRNIGIDIDFSQAQCFTPSLWATLLCYVHETNWRGPCMMSTAKRIGLIIDRVKFSISGSELMNVFS